MVVNLKTSSYDVRIDRNSEWGNPFSHIAQSRAKWIVGSREEAIVRFRQWLPLQENLMARLEELRGRRLGCVCDPLPCHGGVYVDFLEGPEVCVAAAALTAAGDVIRGRRHPDCLEAFIERGERMLHDPQGFITSRNRYVSRLEGRALQDAAGVRSADPGGYRGQSLYSEDLY